MLYFTGEERTVPLSKQLFHSGFSFFVVCHVRLTVTVRMYFS